MCFIETCFMEKQGAKPQKTPETNTQKYIQQNSAIKRATKRKLRSKHSKRHPRSPEGLKRNSLRRALEEYHRRLPNGASMRTALDTYKYVSVLISICARLFLRLHGQCCLVQRTLLRFIQFLQITGWRVIELWQLQLGGVFETVHLELGINKKMLVLPL